MSLLNLGVVNRDIRALCEEVTDKGDGSSFTSVASVRLERETEDSDVLWKDIYIRRFKLKET